MDGIKMNILMGRRLKRRIDVIEMVKKEVAAWHRFLSLHSGNFPLSSQDR